MVSGVGVECKLQSRSSQLNSRPAFSWPGQAPSEYLQMCFKAPWPREFRMRHLPIGAWTGPGPEF